MVLSVPHFILHDVSQVILRVFHMKKFVIAILQWKQVTACDKLIISCSVSGKKGVRDQTNAG